MSTIAPPDPAVDERLQQFELGTVVELFQLDLSPILAAAPTLYFTPSAYPDGAMIRWDGDAYVPIPMEAEGYDVDPRGAVPQPLIRVSNVARILSPILDATQELRGAIVTRHQVVTDWLDAGVDPQPTWYLRRDRHRVEQLATRSAEWLEFRLAATLDRGDEQTPRRQVVRDLCLWTYRRWDPVAADWDYSRATCPYTGTTTFWKSDDSTTLTESEDRCSKRLSGCRLRFAGAPKPFGGFPGAGATR